MCGLLLYRMFALHVEFLGHLVSVIGRQVFVQGLIVSRNTSPNARCMGCEKGAYLGYLMANVEQSHAGHPFISMINHPRGLVQIKAIKALHYPAGCIRKHGSFVVIAITVQTVHLKPLPHLGIYLIFQCIKGLVIHQYGKRMSWN